MDHADALREMSVEKYLFGELTGPQRDDFEDHLFDCQLCAADIQSGLHFADAARADFAAEAREQSRAADKPRSWFDWLLRPQWMAPAFAACLLLLGYQSIFRIPSLQQQLQVAESPKFVDSLGISGGAVRGGEMKHVSARKGGAFGLTVDLPPQTGYTAYEFALLSPSGAKVWTATLQQTQTKDTEQIVIPEAVTQPGQNTLVVQGVRGQGSGDTLETLLKRDFVLDLHE